MHIQPGTSLTLQETRSVGYADFVDGETITGWAIDLQFPMRPLTLCATIDGAEVARIACTAQREDVRAAGIASDVGGFRFELPRACADGQEHRLRLLLPGGGTVCFPARDGAVHEEYRFRLDPLYVTEVGIDTPSADAIEGWVLRRDRHGRQAAACEIAVTLEGQLIARLVADLPRADVARARDCDARVGFRFVAPAALRTGRELELGFSILPDHEAVPGSPVRTTFLPAEATARLASLAAEVDALFTQAYRLRRTLHEMLPGPAHSIDDYAGWARRYRSALHERVARGRTAQTGQGALQTPLVSVVCPVFRGDPAHLAAAVESVRAQTYAHWELILVDDASRQARLSALLAGLAASDPRIRIERRANRGGIAAASNQAIAAARGAWVAFLDHDDLLDPVALEVMVSAAQATGARALFSDEDKIESDGRPCEPHLKPDWNLRLALEVNFACHLLMVEAATLRAVGDLDPALDGAQDHDLLLRLAEHLDAAQIRHVPEILYHWRKAPGSTAGASGAKTHAVGAGAKAVAAYLQRRGFAEARVAPRGRGTQYRIDWGFGAEPKVCIVVPFRDQAQTTRICLELLLARTQYGNFEVVLVDNGSVTEAAASLCREAAADRRVRVRRDDGPFNYARLNNQAIRDTDAPLVMLLNNDVFVEQGDWLRRMVDEVLADPRVAAVGCKLLYPDRRVQHAGVVLGVGGVADHAFRGLAADDPGYVARAMCTQEYAAVTAACLLLRTDAFRAVGGLDQEALAVAFNDVDLCLKLRDAGGRVIWTPDVVCEHHESLSRGEDTVPGKLTRFAAEHQAMVERWGETLACDPFYSRHFSRRGGLFRVLADESLLVEACEETMTERRTAPRQLVLNPITSPLPQRSAKVVPGPRPAAPRGAPAKTLAFQQEFLP